MWADLQLPAAFLFVALVFLLIGYAMGLLAAKAPGESDKKAFVPFDPGPVEEEIDEFNEAMYGEEEEEGPPKRIQTVE